MLQVALTFANNHNQITNQSYFCEDSSLMGYSISPIFKTTLHFSNVSIPQSQLYVQHYQVSSTIQNFLVMEYIHSLLSLSHIQVFTNSNDRAALIVSHCYS